MNSDQSQNTVLETIIPQDKTGGVNRIFMGYSVSEVMLVLIPTFLFFYTATSIFGFAVDQWTAGATGAIGFVLWMVVKITPWYNTPVEILMRNVEYVRSRFRMPLVENEAAEVPGVADIHPDHQAVELPDGRLVGIARVPLINTSQLSHDQYVSQVAQYGSALNSTVGRDAGTGFDMKIHIAQTIPEAGKQVEGLREAAQNGRPVEDGGMPPYARKYAEEQAEQTIDLLEENDVMDREVHMITAVEPNEANGSDGLIDQLSAATSLLKPSDETYDAQAALLDNRMQTMMNSVQGFSNPQRLDANEIARLYRNYWLDLDEGFEYENVTTDGPVTNPEVEIESEAHEQRERPDVDGDAAEDEGKSVTTDGTETAESATSPGETDATPDGEESTISEIREQLPLIGNNSTESIPDPDPATTSPEQSADEPEDEEESEGLHDRISSTVTSLRGHTSEASRQELIHSPAYVNEHAKYAEIDDQYTCTIWVTGWPKHPDAGILEGIFSIPGVRYDIAINLDSTDYHSKLDSLASTRQRVTNSAIMKEDSGEGDAEDASALAADLQVLREQMQDNDAECWEVGVTITVRAETKSAVRDARRQITSRCSAVNISTTTATNRQLAGLRTTSPNPQNNLKEETRVDTRFDMTSATAACLFPFSGYHPVETSGTVYGLAKTGARSTGDPMGVLQADRLHRTAPHRFWVGRSGSGKSFDVKNHIVEEMVRNPTENTVIVDIARGFDGPVKAFNGSKIKVGETTINPFEIRPPEDSQGTQESLDDKVRLVTDMFQIYMMHNSPEEQAQAIRSTISKTVRQTYQNAGPEGDDVGITNDPATHSKKSPTMEDYFDTLAEMSENTEEYTYKNTQTEVDALKEDIGVLLNRLKEFQPNGTYSYFNGESEEDMYDSIVYFDMSDFDNDQTAAKGMIMALITSHAYELAKQTSGHVNLVVDEAHDLFRDAAQADQIESMVRAGRNIGLMFDFISQAGEDFDAGAAKVIAKQCSIAIWRDLGEIDASTPMEFGLTQEQATLVSGDLATGDNKAMDYSEALVDIEGDRYLIERRVSDYVAKIVDYREIQHGDFDAYMDGVSLEEQQADGSSSETDAQQDSESEESEESESDDDDGQQSDNVLGSGIVTGDDVDESKDDATSEETTESSPDPDGEPAVTADDESAEDGAGTDVTEIEGVGDSKADALREAGFESVTDVREADLDELSETEGFGRTSAERLKENAQDVGSAESETPDERGDEEQAAEEPPIPDGSGEPADVEAETGSDAADSTEGNQ